VFGCLSTESVSIESSHFVIGRDKDCQLRPAGLLVSRRHCQIDLGDGGPTVRDLGSTLGTYVNGKRVRDSRGLKTGDLLNVGVAFYLVGITEAAAVDRKHAKHLPRKIRNLGKWKVPHPIQVCN
jgi:pSer/pThr/pTyr-binding forkhead associated (FHA) protein